MTDTTAIITGLLIGVPMLTVFVAVYLTDKNLRNPKKEP